MNQPDQQALQARVETFAAKVDAFASTLSQEEQAWLTGVLATAAASDAAVNGYIFNFNVGNPVASFNLNQLTQTAVGIGNIGNVSNTAAVIQSSNAGFGG